MLPFGCLAFRFLLLCSSLMWTKPHLHLCAIVLNIQGQSNKKPLFTYCTRLRQSSTFELSVYKPFAGLVSAFWPHQYGITFALYKGLVKHKTGLLHWLWCVLLNYRIFGRPFRCLCFAVF